MATRYNKHTKSGAFGKAKSDYRKAPIGGDSAQLNKLWKTGIALKLKPPPKYPKGRKVRGL